MYPKKDTKYAVQYSETYALNKNTVLFSEMNIVDFVLLVLLVRASKILSGYFLSLTCAPNLVNCIKKA